MKKRYLLKVTVLVLLVSVLLTNMVLPAAAAGAVTANPTSSTVKVDGKDVKFEAYTIDGHNYLKLRDLAMALNGTSKQFQVVWLGGNIYLYQNTAYNPVGGELASSGLTGSITAEPSLSSVYIGARMLNLTVYTIGENNYFKLRDVAAAINFGVNWDGASNSISIDSSAAYTPEESTADSGELGPQDYFMIMMCNALSGSSIDKTRTYIYYSVPETGDRIDIQKYAQNNYYIQLVATSSTLSADLPKISSVLTAFIDEPSAVTTALQGLGTSQNKIVTVGMYTFSCFNNGYYSINVTW